MIEKTGSAVSLFFEGIYNDWINYLYNYWPEYIKALFLLLLWALLGFIAYKFVKYLFKKFQIVALIDRFTKPKVQPEAEMQVDSQLHGLGQKIDIDTVVAKSAAYYIFLVFLRYAVMAIGIYDIEKFMEELLTYLPSLFIAALIGFFGIRFSNFIYSVVHGAVAITNAKTASILAMWAKVIILFFTLMAVLSHVGISPLITNTILIGSVSMMTIAWWLAFGLGGKDIAKEILEGFRK